MATRATSLRMRQLADLVASSRPEKCTIWPYGKKNGQYGVVWLNGTNAYAHRVGYEMAGHILQKHDVLRHDCDTPACVNPYHLTPGTTADNVADRVKRGRGACGTRHSRAKLTEQQVHEIRASPLTAVALAKIYGVSDAMIGNVRRRDNWRHI